MAQTILKVEGLKTWFHTSAGVAKAVDGVSFEIKAGEVLGLVGESGCGKSVTSMSILGLVPRPGRVESGKVFFEGKDLLEANAKEMRALRGEKISMIFQQPQSALNPVYRAGDQISEVYEIHRKIKKKVGSDKARELLGRLGIPDPERRARSYPHELSGGMAQRVMIAMALALEPALLIADEPTTALDVTIQAQILDLIRDLQVESQTAVLLITHDLGVVAEMADRVAVMYAGEIVETAPVKELFATPKHPYTQGLIGSVPVLGSTVSELTTIPGIVPKLIDMPDGCRFAERCAARTENNLEMCTVKRPELKPLEVDSVEDSAHLCRCWLHEPDADTQLSGDSAVVGAAVDAASGAGDNNE